MILKYKKINKYTVLLTLNRPHVLNSLNLELLKELEKKLVLLKKNKKIRTVIINGAGDKAFVGGADIAAMKDMNEKEALEFSKFGNSIFEMIEKMDKIFIAAVDGYALGGGNELLAACDIRIASPNSKFGQPEVKLGIIPGFGGTQRLPEIIGCAEAKKLIYTGEIISAEKALKIGLINQIIEKSKLMEKAEQLAGKISENAPLAVAAAKNALLYRERQGGELGFAFESKLFSGCFKSRDQTAGMEAFLKNQKAEFKGE